jgi:IS5 family transposase
MRKSLLDQLPLVPAVIDHPFARELAVMSAVLDQLPEATELVHEALIWRGGKRVDPTKGRDGMAAEQVLRVAVLKQMSGFSYAELAFHLLDSSTYRIFCRLGYNANPPTKSTLQKNMKRVSPEAWEGINRSVVRKAKDLGLERGAKVRTDCTVVESNIHHPTDSSLLWDSVRVLVRILGKTKEEFGIAFTDHTRRAKRRWYKIANSKSSEQRKPLYRDLIKVTEKTVRQAQRAADELGKVVPDSIAQSTRIGIVIDELHQYTGLANQVLSQAERRVMRGESVPAGEKIVSIFEPHTDIIVKDRQREPDYGHKVCLTTGESGMIVDLVVEDGNPADVTLAVKTISRIKSLFDEAPRQASFDGAFAARANLAEIKALGVADVAFNKRCGLEITDMVKTKAVYRALSAFRAGIEGSISFLKRSFGLVRCTWRGLSSFKAYAHLSALACNLLVVARRILIAAA